MAGAPLVPVVLSWMESGSKPLSVLAIDARGDGATDGAQRNASWPKSLTLSGSAKADGEIATAAMTSPAQMTISVLLRGQFWARGVRRVRVLSRRSKLSFRGGGGMYEGRSPKVSREHASEPPEFRIADGIDRDPAEEVEFTDEPPRRLKISELSVARRAAPGPDDPEAAAPDPVAPQVDDEFFLAARDDERAEHLTAVPET